MTLKLFLATSFLFIGADLHINQECFQTGECRKALHIDGEVLSDEFACLDFCNSNAECSWMTYFPNTSYCQLYQNCPVLDTEYCKDCLSSQSDCIPDNPVCFVNGECDGIVHHTQPSASAEECLQICNSTVSCRWFTFERAASQCIILETCPSVDESCDTCISGERRCISTPSSTTTSTTEFTTTATPERDYIAFMVGGLRDIQTEVYSPNGNCNVDLTPIPETLYLPTLAHIDDKIIACSGGPYDTQGCSQYSVTKNNWTSITTFPFKFTYPIGVVHNDKIYIIDDLNPGVYDPRNNSWSTWPKPLKRTGAEPCLISWKDSILAIGGYANPQLVQSFNFTLNSWSVLDEGTPFDLYAPSCILLPTNKVLFVGSKDDYNAAAVYDIGTNCWKKLKDTKNNHFGAPFVNLNGRIFLIGGGHTRTAGYLVEEFHYNNNTWTEVEVSPINPQLFSKGLVLPADTFAHLPGGCEGIK